MNFSEVYNLILESCPFLGGNSYDGIIVKKLAATNTISDTGSSHQSHMAFTGKQKDFFPFLEADGYFNVGYDNKDDDLKKYYTLRIPLNIYADNVNSLSQEHASIEFNSPKKVVRASVLRSRRKGQEDQVELSIKSLDDKDFIEFRKLLRVNDFFVILKKQNVLEYDLIGISSSDKNAAVLATCTDFYKLTTQTPVDIDFFGDVKKEANESNILPFTPSQIIYYGVPGCGKSHQINKKIKSIPDYNKIRTVFHLEYTNADFIGQILPEVCVDTNGHSVVEYKFNPGPFTEIVRRAYLNPDEEFFLVIEEINRGNAAAIFGDMFQLLDRLDADEKPEEVSSEHVYGKDWSTYGVDNPDINAYIRNQLVISSERPEHSSKVNGSGEDANPRLYKSVDIESENVNVTWKEKNGNGFTPKPKHLHFSANTAIRLPPNLSIYATMNTSDQNVFTLDNAFQRRWDMELVSNTCKWDDEDHKHQAQLPIGDTDIRWETFREAINAKISGEGFFNADDKQLGLFFIEAEDGKINGKKFANKVLKYLWADVFKRNTDKIFKSKNLSKMVDGFTGADAFDKVFVEDFVKSLNDANDAIKNHE